MSASDLKLEHRGRELVRKLAFGLGVGLTAGLVRWAETPSSESLAGTPTTTLKADRALTLLRGLTVGLAAGLAFGLAFGLTAGLTLGLIAGLVLGEHHAWLAYVIAVDHLARRGDAPRDLMAFLDDAHRLGLLRTVGPLYQFRHAELQEHLAINHQPPYPQSPDRSRA